MSLQRPRRRAALLGSVLAVAALVAVTIVGLTLGHWGEASALAPSAAPGPSADVLRTPYPSDAGVEGVGGFPWPPLESPDPDPHAWHVPVLTYHLIDVPGDAGPALPGLVVSPALFDQQLGELQRAGWHTITAGALAEDLRLGHKPPPRTFVITLDDGHEDGYTQAFPILQAHGFVATYFVITGRIGWTYYLTREEVQALAAGGMEIADHTVDHVPLASEPLPKATAEMEGADVWIDELLGSPPTTIAYPFGSSDAAVAKAAAALNLEMGFTTQSGCRETWASRMLTPRLRVGPSTTPLDLLRRLSACG